MERYENRKWMDIGGDYIFSLGGNGEREKVGESGRGEGRKGAGVKWRKGCGR